MGWWGLEVGVKGHPLYSLSCWVFGVCSLAWGFAPKCPAQPLWGDRPGQLCRADDQLPKGIRLFPPHPLLNSLSQALIPHQPGMGMSPLLPALLTFLPGGPAMGQVGA